MFRRTAAAALALVLVPIGCDTHPTELPANDRPAFDFTNGPSVLPRVLRSGGRVISAFLDVERDIVLIVGAPEDPSADVVCGGTEPRQFILVQWVGEFLDLAKQLALQESANLLVYSPIPASLAAALCGTSPIASGTGFYLRTDNDFFGAGGRGNAFSEHVHHTLELTVGGAANLNAVFRGVGLPDGTLFFLETMVLLQPIG